MRKLKLFLACLLMAVLSIGQMWGADVINNAATSAKCGNTATNTWVANFTISGTSGADYYIHTMGTKNTSNALQWNANGFLNQTKSGGTLKSITIKGTSGKSIDVFAANSAYSTSTPSGTAVTTMSLTGNDVTYTFTSNYTYFALKGKGSSTQIVSITIEYASGGSDPIAVTSVTLDESAIILEEDETKTLTATVLPNNATEQSVTWESDDETVAKVEEGVVTAVGAGDATITCKSVADETKKAECTVHVNPSPYTKSKLIFSKKYADGGATASDDAEWTVESDGTESSFDPDKGIHYGTGSAEVQYIRLSTNDINGTIARIVVNASTANGVTATVGVTVNGAAFGGDAQSISASAADYIFTGSASGEIVVTVTKPSSATKAIYVKSVVVYYTPAPQKQSTGLAYEDADKNNLVKVGAGFSAPTLTNPNNLTGITYVSSDDAIVEVNESTGAIVAIKAAGKAVITASRAEDNDYKAGSASYTIYVATEAGTDTDPLSEASAKALIDLGCTMSAHVTGTILTKTFYNSGSYNVTLTDGFIFYYFYAAENSTPFESDILTNGDVLVGYGQLTKYGNNYEINPSYMVSRVPYTEPLVDISNTKETAYTVAEALELAVNPTSDLTKAVYIKGVVYDVKSFNQTNGTLDIYIKDNGVDNKFEFFKCAGIYDESLTAFTAADDVQEGDEVIGYGVMKYYSGGSIWEFDNNATGDYLVDLVRPEVAVSSIELDQDEASIEVNETVTLHATINPDNASNKAITWSVQSGSDYASVDEGVVTGNAEGVAVIRAASTADPTKYAECTVTVTAADPTKHVVTFDATVDKGESPLEKNNISMACSSGVLNNESEYRLYKNSTTTFTCSAGNITKIEFTGKSGNPVSGFEAPEVGGLAIEGDDGVWTGNAASVSFVASGAQVRATVIKVTYKDDTRAASGLAWSAEEVEITLGDAFTPATLQNPNNIDAAEISIESSNTSLATVTAGVVALVADATGTATITATFAGNDDYKPATISYNITVNEAGLDNVTFDSSEDHAESGETTITKGGFTLSFTSGSMDGTQAEYRLYKGQTMTLSSTDYKIKKIEFTCTSGNPITGFADATGLDKDNNEWTGESNTVELTASNAQVRMTKIKVFYVEDTRAAAGLAWDPADDIELTVGDAFSAPALVKPNDITVANITIASNNLDLATVNEGVVSLVENATGEATITATFTGDEKYKPATVSYNISVNAAPVVPTAIYNKVPSGAYLTSGEYLLVYEEGNVAFNGALTTLDAVSNTIAVTISDNKINGTDDIDAATFTIDVAAGTIQAKSGKYIGQGSDANGLTASDEALENTLSIDADGNFVAVSDGGAYLRYNNAINQTRFRYFKSSSYTSQKAVQLYKKGDLEFATYTRNVTEGNYGTICLPYAGTISGAALYKTSYRANGMIYCDEILSGELEAGKPYIFKANSDKLNVTYTAATAETAADENGLYGYYELAKPTATFDIPEDDGNYVLYQNQYWLVSGREAYIANYRAYIKLDEISTSAPILAPGVRRVAMTVHSEQTATGMDELNASEAPVKVLINGQMYILRGEKMYNVNGQLVK